MKRPLRVLVIRSAPGLRGSLDAAREAGFEPIASPTSDIERMDGAPPPPAGAVLVFTSANGPAALPESADRRARVFAVGPATADAAYAAGFADVETGPGDAQALTEMIAARLGPEDAPIVHLRGQDAAFDIAEALRREGYSAQDHILYRAVERPTLEETARAALEAQRLDAAAVYSRKGADAFLRQIEAAHLTRAAAELAFAALSSAVAEGLMPLAPRRIAVAREPRETSLMSALSRIAAGG